MKTETALAALLLAAVTFLTFAYSNNKVDGEHFRIQSIKNGVSRHDCELILGDPKWLLPETDVLRAAYVYELSNDWHFMIYFSKHGNYVHSFGIQPAYLAIVDRPAFASK